MVLSASSSTLLTDPYDRLPLTVTSATPSPRRSPPSTPTSEASLTSGDLIMIKGNGENMFPVSRTQLSMYSPKLRATIEKLTPSNNVISVPEDDWVIHEMLRWMNCTGLFVESTDAVTNKGLRLAILMRAAHEYEISVALAFFHRHYLTEDLVRDYPFAALAIGVKGRLPAVQRQAEEILNSYPLPPTDTTDLQLWLALTADERISIFRTRRQRTRNLQDKIFEFVHNRVEDWACNRCCDAGSPPAGWITWEKHAMEEVARVPSHTNVIAKGYVAECMDKSGCDCCRQKLDDVEGIKALEELENSIKVE